MAKARKEARKVSHLTVSTLMPRNCPPSPWNAGQNDVNSTMSIVPAVRPINWMESSRPSDPAIVYKKNLIEAYRRLSPPQRLIRKYIGTRPISQNRKKIIRSSATKTPIRPASSNRKSIM